MCGVVALGEQWKQPHCTRDRQEWSLAINEITSMPARATALLAAHVCTHLPTGCWHAELRTAGHRLARMLLLSVQDKKAHEGGGFRVDAPANGAAAHGPHHEPLPPLLQWRVLGSMQLLQRPIALQPGGQPDQRNAYCQEMAGSLHAVQLEGGLCPDHKRQWLPLLPAGPVQHVRGLAGDVNQRKGKDTCAGDACTGACTGAGQHGIETPQACRPLTGTAAA